MNFPFVEMQHIQALAAPRARACVEISMASCNNQRMIWKLINLLNFAKSNGMLVVLCLSKIKNLLKRIFTTRVRATDIGECICMTLW